MTTDNTPGAEVDALLDEVMASVWIDTDRLSVMRALNYLASKGHLKTTGEDAWRPISEAPRDGTRVLGLGHDLVIYTIKYANKFAPQYGLKEGAHGWYCYNTDNPIVGITHFMPLPPAPRGKE